MWPSASSPPRGAASPPDRRRHGSEHLAGVQDAQRVEDLLDPPLQTVGGLAQLLPQPRPLEDADPVLAGDRAAEVRSEEHTSELQSRQYLVCRLLLEKKKKHQLNKCCT